MGFGRKFAVGVLASLLTTLLFLAAVDFSLYRIVGSPTEVKKVISDSGLYNNVISNALDQAQSSANTGGISLSNPTVKAAANAAFTPQQLQADTNQIIDSVYAWLNGKTAQPNFKIDLSGLKTSFANNVAQAVETRAASLPRCTSLPSSTTIDALNADCLPPGVTPAEVAAQAKDSILSDNNFLTDPVLTADSLKKSGANQSVFATTYQNAPHRYQQAKKTPYILAALAVLDAIGIVLLSPSYGRGLRRVGISLLVTGVILLAFTWLFSWGVNQKLTPRLNTTNVVQSDVKTLAQDIVKSVGGGFRLFGIIYVVLGAGALAAPMVMARRSPKAAPAKTAEAEPADQAPKKPD